MTKKSERGTTTAFGMLVNGNTRAERVLREALKTSVQVAICA